MADGVGHRNAWGPLAERYSKPRPRRMLSLDGGGIRGIISVEVVAKLESLLRQHYSKPDLVLADFFDYIGGTSTGAIIAAALAIGKSAGDVKALYSAFGEQVFTKRGLFGRLTALYQNGPLEQKLKEVLGKERTLRPECLRTLLLVVMRNATTDSAWPVSSNPNATYNQVGRDYCNLDLPLWQLVRASTAAPVYFPPEIITMWGAKGPLDFVFVDGGTTAYNNPGFLMYRMATAPPYRLGWPSGERNLLLVSIGTGSAPALGQTVDDPNMNALSNAFQTLSCILNQAQWDQDLSCRSIGRCVYGGVLDREIHDMIPRDEAAMAVPLDHDLGRAFIYARYDVDLTRQGLTDLGLADIDPAAVASLDSVESIQELEAIGRALAGRLTLDHFRPFLF